MGDFNIPDTRGMWGDLKITGEWRDTHYVQPESDAPAYPTCWLCNGLPFRLDYFAVNNMCATHVRSTGRAMDVEIPVHFPLAIDIDMEAAPPTEIPVNDGGFRLRHPTTHECENLQKELEEALAHEDLDDAYLKRSRFWQLVLLRSFEVEKPEHVRLGRGAAPKEALVYPKSSRKLAIWEGDAFLANLMARVCQLSGIEPCDSEHYQGLLRKVARQTGL